MDKETREFLDRKFNAIDERFNGIDEKFNGIDEKFVETKRYFGVVAEGLRSEIRQVAEGHEVIRDEIQALREENELAHKEILSAIKFSYAELNQRIRTIESEVITLKSRMDRLEARQN